MRLFHWLCAEDIPPGCDLRSCGWQLGSAPPSASTDGGVSLAPIRCIDSAAWERLLDPVGRPRRARVLVLGVGDGAKRARLLEMGFGEVIGGLVPLRELAERADRVAGRAAMLPRRVEHGSLTLDLLLRDGFVGERRLGFHPREFALLWRLAETPGVAVAKSVLLHEVWRLLYVPETNSLAVHVSRLRAKLASVGLDGLVQTAAADGYLLAPDAGRAIPLAKHAGERADLLR